jgi:hypothetical protein
MSVRIEAKPVESTYPQEEEFKFPTYNRIVDYLSKHPLSSVLFTESFKTRDIVGENIARFFANKRGKEITIRVCVEACMDDSSYFQSDKAERIADLIIQNLTWALMDCARGKKIPRF